MRKTAVIILAKGFEEIESVTPIDLLVRSGVQVIIAGLTDTLVKGSRGITIKTDCLIDEIPDEFDALILPGGPGAKLLAASDKVTQLIKKQNKAGRLIAAICAAPAVVLNPTGILSGKKMTAFPGYEKDLNPDVTHVDKCVVVDGPIITSKGPGTAFEFSLRIAEILVGREIMEKVSSATQYLV